MKPVYVGQLFINCKITTYIELLINLLKSNITHKFGRC